ncbi:TetR/AcrR family transcriptional regulator [Umezawaea endophytica]|uniref:TetR/AcrR family transcriptional regulator n=1 Tax=Umezawaea endophytica TaxID=1654476 RepID=A0A9X3AFG1_9PSEU|nr:TetR/AcrR family transcriptional regulator [Umezawaea endophytica]MCS7478712.1 TetR/AcrR family transcriptional regulator [Umezawaea endophytica]
MSGRDKPQRRRNKPGEGGLLREDVLVAGFEILQQEGAITAVTLRAVAARVGITAPSLYAHFRDVTHLHSELRNRAFEQLIEACDAAAAGIADPILDLFARAERIVTWGVEFPGRHRLMFTRIDNASDAAGYRSFDALVATIRRCVRASGSASTDPAEDGAYLLAALNGLVMTRTTMTGFPWPDLGQAVREITSRIVRIPDVPPPSADG